MELEIKMEITKEEAKFLEDLLEVEKQKIIRRGLAHTKSYHRTMGLVAALEDAMYSNK